ncbi:MAG: hypothetical protein F4Y44_00910, partial [Chloroflexi bacterium]|nr:hypothetical protein [Chloroflexota bacterium]
MTQNDKRRQSVMLMLCSGHKGDRVIHKRVVSYLRLVLLAATAAALANVACYGSEAEIGTVGVCSTESGELLTHGRYVIYISNDGGFTWEWEGGIEGCVGASSKEQSVETPRGRYTIEGTDIVRAFDGKTDIAYSAIAISERADRVVIEAATKDRESRIIVLEPQAIHYDDRSGNVVAAMGLQGVVVGTPNGKWTSVGAGPYQPVDFSILGRLRLLNQTSLWAMAFALSTSLTALAMIISGRGFVRVALAAISVAGALLATTMFSFNFNDFQKSLELVIKSLCAFAIISAAISLLGARIPPMD